jgi:hypothetical protein
MLTLIISALVIVLVISRSNARKNQEFARGYNFFHVLLGIAVLAGLIAVLPFLIQLAGALVVLCGLYVLLKLLLR